MISLPGGKRIIVPLKQIECRVYVSTQKGTILQTLNPKPQTPLHPKNSLPEVASDVQTHGLYSTKGLGVM